MGGWGGEGGLDVLSGIWRCVPLCPILSSSIFLLVGRCGKGFGNICFLDCSSLFHIVCVVLQKGNIPIFLKKKIMFLIKVGRKSQSAVYNNSRLFIGHFYLHLHVDH